MGAKNRDDGSPERFLGGMFQGLDRLLDLAEKLSREEEQSFTRHGEIKLGPQSKAAGGIRGAYDVAFRLGPVAQTSSPRRPAAGGSRPRPGQREPVIDIYSEDDIITLVAQMPGLEPRHIQIETDGDTVIIQGRASDYTYYREVKLAAAIRPESMEWEYKNGLLIIKTTPEGEVRNG